jgi:hypothetical protein
MIRLKHGPVLLYTGTSHEWKIAEPTNQHPSHSQSQCENIQVQVPHNNKIYCPWLRRTFQNYKPFKTTKHLLFILSIVFNKPCFEHIIQLLYMILWGAICTCTIYIHLMSAWMSEFDSQLTRDILTPHSASLTLPVQNNCSDHCNEII